MQKALGNLFRSIAEVVDNGAAENQAGDAVAVATAPDAPNVGAAETGMSNDAVEDGIIDLIDTGDFTHRKATTLAEKLGVPVERVKVVAEDSEDLFIYTKRDTDEVLIRLN